MTNLRRTLGVFGTVLATGWLGWSLVSGTSPTILAPGDSWAIRQTLVYPVVGNLGGIPVSIPKPYANFVEYDGDPHFMEARKGPPPLRTYDSPLRSFGFDIRFPDMHPETEEIREEKRKESIQRTMWMRVGVHSNSTYGYDGEHKMTRFVENQLRYLPEKYRFEKLSTETYDLIGYGPTNVDLLRRELGGGGADMSDQNLYFHRDALGEVDVYIKCGNMSHSANRCQQTFVLLPTMRAMINVGYRKELLPHWREIQSSVTHVMLGFRVDQPTRNKSN
jgi:hypothetical protein